MRITMILILVSLTFGCAQPPINKTQLNELEEVFEFDIVDHEIAQRRSTDFIEDIYQRHNKARFDIHYQPDASEFVDSLLAYMKRLGINPNRIQANIQSSETNKQVSIISSYIHIHDKSCGTLYFAQAESYPFGCITNYNHTQMLANPEKLRR